MSDLYPVVSVPTPEDAEAHPRLKAYHDAAATYLEALDLVSPHYRAMLDARAALGELSAALVLDE